MGDATTLEEYQVTQRNKQNAAGEQLDQDGLIEYFDDMANEWDKFLELPNWKLSKEVCAQKLHEVVNNTSARILDGGCGTGNTSEELFKLGYKNIDGLDFSPKMLDVAYAKGVLKNTIEDTIDGKHKTNIPNDTYDAVICTGTFCPGQMDQESFPELTRITKPDGHILFNVSLKYLDEWKLYQNGQLDLAIHRQIATGIWQRVTKELIPYWKDEQCMLYTITV